MKINEKEDNHPHKEVSKFHHEDSPHEESKHDQLIEECRHRIHEKKKEHLHEQKQMAPLSFKQQITQQLDGSDSDPFAMDLKENTQETMDTSHIEGKKVK